MSQIEIDFSARTIKSLGGEGILSDADMKQLSAGVQRVFNLMNDGQWYSREQIEMAAGTMGYPAKEGIRRLRELRKYFTIEKKLVVGRHRHYRIVFNQESKAA